MTDIKEIAKELRKAFPPAQVGQLPRGGVTLDYVGHADVTSRLLEVDPEWNWEPVASDEHGLPVFDHDGSDRPVGLWIRLTVGGVTRLGYGSCPSNQNDAVKVLIGDALRNAAMRFGVALDLWAKGDRADPSAENATASGGQAQRRKPRQSREEAGPAEPSADVDDGDWGVWTDVIKDITTPEEADQADTDLREVFKTGAMGPTKAGNIRAAIKKKAASLGDGPPSPNGKRREEVPA